MRAKGDDIKAPQIFVQLGHRASFTAQLDALSSAADKQVQTRGCALEEILGGRYRLIKRLGSGGMAEVFLAEQTGPRGFARQTVIKRILMHHAEEPEFVKSFEDEARLAARLQHPNIVRTEDFGDHDGQLFLALEYVPGEDLDTLSRSAEGQDIGLPPAVILQVGVDVAEALEHAHTLSDENGDALDVVHRDVSPHNIMVTPKGEAKLLDFGIARAASNHEHTQAGKIKGKAAYFCPEQARGDSLDGRTDQFALAIVLYELLARRRLFLDTSLITTLQRVSRCQVPSLTGFRKDLPEVVDAVLRRALSRDRQDRFIDCADFADALRDCLKLCGGRLRPRDYSRWREGFLSACDAKTRVRLKPMVSDAGTGGLSETEMPTLLVGERPDFDDNRTELSGPPPSLLPGADQPAAEWTGSHPKLAAANDRFFGRQEELLELDRRLVEEQRLITLLGPGGIGKTRLAQQFAAQNPVRFSAGLWFCDLSEVHTVEGLIAAVASSIGLPLSQSDPAQQLSDALSGRGSLMLILDNFEQLRSRAGDVLSNWLSQAPELRLLVTSEVRLGLPGESAFVLNPLPLPDAMRLFFDRGQAMQQDFRPDDDNEPIVRDIVERLDRMPLAIELAAARLRLMPPATIRQRLSQRFRLLRCQQQDQSQRQATLRGTIEWSWNLLESAEQQCLAQLSVFHGGFSLDAAEAVLDLSASEGEPWVIDSLSALVDHSLLVINDVKGAVPRYRLLESLREFAAERLGHDAPLIRRHAQFFASLGSPENQAALNSQGGAAVRSLLRSERENLIQGVAGGLQTGELEAAAGCALAAGHLFDVQGPARDGITLIEGVLEHKLSQNMRAGLLRQLGALYQIAGQAQNAKQPLEEAHKSASGYTKMLNCGSLGRLCQQLGDAPRAQLLFDEGIALAESLNNRFHQALLLGTSAFLMHRSGQSQSTVELFERALQLARHSSVDNRRAEANVLGSMAAFFHERGHKDEALRRYEQAVVIHKAHGDQRYLCIPMGNLALLYHDMKRFDDALSCGQETLKLSRKLGLKSQEGVLLGNLGALFIDRGEPEAAKLNLIQAIEICTQHMPDAAGAFHGRLALLVARDKRFAEAHRYLAKGEPLLRGFNEPALGAFLARSAQVHELSGDRQSAQAAYDEALGIAKGLETQDDAEICVELTTAKALLSSADHL
jgi:predicted ATPase/serine/threonine protein kinase/Tfp pilus assembly protein PilF